MTTLCMCDFVEVGEDRQRKPLSVPLPQLAARVPDQVQAKTLGLDPFTGRAVVRTSRAPAFAKIKSEV